MLFQPITSNCSSEMVSHRQCAPDGGLCVVADVHLRPPFRCTFMLVGKALITVDKIYLAWCLRRVLVATDENSEDDDSDEIKEISNFEIHKTTNSTVFPNADAAGISPKTSQS